MQLIGLQAFLSLLHEGYQHKQLFFKPFCRPQRLGQTAVHRPRQILVTLQSEAQRGDITVIGTGQTAESEAAVSGAKK